MYVHVYMYLFSMETIFQKIEFCLMQSNCLAGLVLELFFTEITLNEEIRNSYYFLALFCSIKVV